MMDRFDEAASETEMRCAGNVHMAGIRESLRVFEHDANTRDWDDPANIAQLFEMTELAPGPWGIAAGFGIRYAGPLQAVFDWRQSERNGDVGLAMLDIAAAVEFGGERVRRELGLERTDDAYRPDLEDAKIYGWGLISEAWMLEGDSADEHEQTRRDRTIDQHPDRIETRLIWLAGRDGLSWYGHRIRGGDFKVMVELPESIGGKMQGNVPDGLHRITQAVAGTVMPHRNQ